MSEDRRLSAAFNWLVGRGYTMNFAKLFAEELIGAIDLVDPLRQQPTENSEPTPGAAFSLIANLATRLSQTDIAEQAIEMRKMSHKIKPDRETTPVKTSNNHTVADIIRFADMCWYGNSNTIVHAQRAGIVSQQYDVWELKPEVLALFTEHRK